MTIKLYICEDSAPQRAAIEQCIQNYCLFSPWEMVLSYSTGLGEELLENIDRENKWNVYFLDINLDEEAAISNGLILAQEIRTFDPLGFIIFITIRSELSFLTFQYKVQALDFIVKSSAFDINARVHACLQTIELRLEALTLPHGRTIKLNIGSDIRPFFLKDILYFSSNKTHIISLHTKNKVYLIHQATLNALEEQLDNEFLRCHRSFLINPQAIAAIAKDFRTLTLNNQDQIPVSVRKKAKLRALSMR